MNLDSTNGLVIPTQAQITASFVLAITTNISPSFAIQDDNILSQIIVINSSILINLFDTLQACFMVINPQTASGLNLIDACQYVGVDKQGALKTQVYLLLTTATETIFPANTTITVDEFSISNQFAIPIARGSCSQAIVNVVDAVDGQVYSFELNDLLVTYTAGPSDSTTTIASALAALVVTSAPLFVSSSVSGHANQLLVNKTTNAEIDYSQAFSINVVSGDLTVPSFSAYSNFYNSVTGNVTIPANTFNVDTGIAGVLATQPLDSINGQDADTDQKLRLRRDQSLARGGNRTINAIEAELLRTPYVKDARVFQNTLNEPFPITDSLNLLPHSIYCVVLGGEQTAIATAIFNKMSEGIQTNGITSVLVQDITYPSYPNIIIVNFDYVTQVSISVQINITIDKNLIYKLPKNIQAVCKNSAFQNILNLAIGEPMYIDDIKSAVGSNISYGLKDISVSYKILPDDTVYTDTLIIDANQITVSTEPDITVVVIAT